MKQILVSGSTAYDTLLHIDKNLSSCFQDNTNTSLLSSIKEKHCGGTGANIAYSLALLGEHAILLSSIGDDFRFGDTIQEKINLKYLHKQPQCLTASSVIVSDSQNNKFTVFHPGAMKYASESKVSFVEEDISHAIISANHIETMLEHARELSKKGVTCVIDPAQQISQMSGSQLKELMSYGDILITNHHEYAELQSRSSHTDEEIRSFFKYVIITYGEQGSQIHQDNSIVHIPSIVCEHLEDTTGAGDAYRAGMLKGLIEGLDITNSCRLGSLLASYSILSPGSQHHHFSLGNLSEDMKKYFDIDIDLHNKRKY